MFTISLATQDFYRLFGADHKIGERDQAQTDVERLLRDYLGVIFFAQPADARQKNRVQLQVTPMPPVTPGLEKRTQALLDILPRYIDPAVRKIKHQDALATFITEKAIGLKAAHGDGVSLKPVVEDRGYVKSFAIDGIAGNDLRTRLQRQVLTEWKKTKESIDKELGANQLKLEDLAALPVDDLGSRLSRKEKQAFADRVRAHMGVEPAVRQSLVRDTTPVRTAMVYLPSLLAENVETSWQHRSQSGDDQKPEWGDYLAELRAFSGLEITFDPAALDWRAGVHENNQRLNEELLRAEAEFARICAEADALTAKGDEADPADLRRNQRAKSGKEAQIDRIKANIQDNMAVRGEYAFVREGEKSPEGSTLPVLRIMIPDGRSVDEENAQLLELTADILSRLVKRSHGQAVDYAERRGEFERQMERWNAARAKINVDEKLKAQLDKEKELYRKAVEAATIYGAQADKDPIRHGKMLKDAAAIDPDRDRPLLKREPYVALSDLKKMIETAKRKAGFVSAAPAVVPEKQVEPQKDDRAEKQREFVRQRAAEAARQLTQSHVFYPVGMSVVIERLKAYLSDVSSRLNIDGDIKASTLAEQQGFFIPVAHAVTVMPVLAKLVAHAANRTIHRDDVDEILKAAVNPKRDVAVAVFAGAGQAVTAAPIILADRLTSAQVEAICGPDNVNLRLVDKKFPGIALTASQNRIVVGQVGLDAARTNYPDIRVRLTSIFLALSQASRSGVHITQKLVERAIGQAEKAARTAVEDINLEPIDISALKAGSLVAQVKRDHNPLLETHSPREMIHLTPTGRDALNLLKRRDVGALEVITGWADLPQFNISPNTDVITLVSRKRKNDEVWDDGLAPLEKGRDALVAAVKLVAERNYQSTEDCKAAVDFVIGRLAEDKLPAAKSKMSGKEAKEQKPTGVALIGDINAFVPTGNQVYADEVLSGHINGYSAVVGPAGAGKTELAMIKALQAVQQGLYDQIIMTTPMENVGGGKDTLGATPGDKNQKMDRWFKKYRAKFAKLLGPANDEGKPNLLKGAKIFDELFKAGLIKFEIMEDMRGEDYDRTFMIVDEAQNTSKELIKVALGRITETSKIVLAGDVDQADGNKRGKHQCDEIRLSAHISIEDGDVFFNKGKKIKLGTEEQLGAFTVRDNNIYVKPHNGLCHALLLYSAIDEFSVAVLDRTDIHRHKSIGKILALDEAAAVSGRTWPAIINGRGGLDTQRVLLEEEQRVAARDKIVAQGSKIIQLRQPG